MDDISVRAIGRPIADFVRGQIVRTSHSLVIRSRDVEPRVDALSGFIGEVGGASLGHGFQRHP